jgi:aminopeptidase N
MRRSLFAALVLAAALPASVAAQRQTGVIGAYVPPRDWAQEPRRFDLLHQTIGIRFDVPHRTLYGSVVTKVVITEGNTDTLRLNAENLTIDRATDANNKPLRFTADTAHVTVRLARTAHVGDTVQFSLTYHGVPERGLYFVPRRNIVWSQGEATETRAWVPTYDAPNDKATWEFFVTVDSTQKVLSNGRLVGVADGPGGQKVWHWSQEKPASTYLYSMVVGPFTVLTDHWRGIPVEYFTYADTVASAWRSFGETPAMMETYSQVLGVPFQWDKYDQSIIPDFTFGGMENVSATTQTDLALQAAGQAPQGDARGLNAHELAHQWFGDLTTAATWAHIWLNEGLTTYMESVQNEKSRGWEAGQLSWWNQQQQAMGADQNEVRSLVWGTYQGTDPIVLFFSGHVYPKGAQLAHQMRRLLGDSLFWAGMHRFLTDNAFKPVTTADYAVAMEKTCNCDLDWFFDQWAYGIGYPKVQFQRHWAAGMKTLHVIVRQTQPIDSLHPLFRFPATIRVITRDSVVRQNVMMTRQVDTFAIALPSEPLSFRFDEGGWLLGTVAGDQTPAELAAMAEHDLDFLGRNWALMTLDGSTDPEAVAARRFIVLNEHSSWLRQVALGQMAHDSTPDGKAIVTSALRDADAAVRATALGTLGRLDRNAALSVAEPMYRSDPNFGVRTQALTLIASRGVAALPILLQATGTDQVANVRITAARGLSTIHDPQAVAALTRMTVPSETRDLRQFSLRMLATNDPARATEVALHAVGDYDPLFAVAAVQTAARVGGAPAKAQLTQALRTETRVTVRSAIQGALAH